MWDHVGRTVIDLPAGTYLVREPNALIDAAGGRTKANGLRFRGAGKRMTQIVFAPRRAEDAYLGRNEACWANVMFEHIGFRSGTPGASFLYSYSTGQARDYRFTECEWLGEWTYGLALDGSNTNSEMRWYACPLSGRHVHRPDGDCGNGGGGRTAVRYDMCLPANHGRRDFVEGAVDRVRFVDCLDR